MSRDTVKDSGKLPDAPAPRPVHLQRGLVERQRTRDCWADAALLFGIGCAGPTTSQIIAGETVSWALVGACSFVLCYLLSRNA